MAELVKATQSVSQRLFWVLSVALGVMLVPSGAYYAYWVASGNLHEVEAGRYYRAGQLDSEMLDQVIKHYGIRSILNLRGENRGSPWYDDEMATAAMNGITHLDYHLSARQRVSVPQLQAILALLHNAPKPVLVHCLAGADRTGLVTAVYHLSQGADPEMAAEALSLRYGHFPFLGSETRAMDDSFAAYVAATTTLTPPTN